MFVKILINLLIIYEYLISNWPDKTEANVITITYFAILCFENDSLVQVI